MITEFVWSMESCRKGAKYLVQWMQVENSPMMCLISKDNMSRYVSLAITHGAHILAPCVIFWTECFVRMPQIIGIL